MLFRPRKPRPRESRPKPVTNAEIAAGLAAMGELPDATDREWLRLDAATRRAKKPRTQ